MDEILFERATFGGYKPETVDEYVDKSQALIGELGEKVAALQSQLDEYQQASDKVDTRKREYEDQLSVMRATVEQQKTELEALTAQLAQAKQAAQQAQSGGGDDSAADEDLRAANLMISKLHGELAKLTAENKEKQSEEVARLKELLQAANAELADTRAAAEQLQLQLSQCAREDGQDQSMTRFIAQFNQDFSEIFEKAQGMANEYIQNAHQEMDELKRQAEADVEQTLAQANDLVAAIVKESEENAQSIRAQAEAEQVEVQKRIAAEMQRAKEDVDAIIDSALYDAYMLEMEAQWVKETADTQANEIFSNATSEAEEILQTANETLDAARREADYKLQLAEERAQTILTRAREKTEKNLASAKAEYNKIRDLTERTLQNYRRLSEPLSNMDAAMDKVEVEE